MFLLEDGSVTAVTGKVVKKKTVLYKHYFVDPHPQVFYSLCLHFWIFLGAGGCCDIIRRGASVCVYLQTIRALDYDGGECGTSTSLFDVFSKCGSNLICFFFFVAKFFRHLHVILLSVKLLLTFMNSLPNFLTPRAIS